MTEKEISIDDFVEINGKAVPVSELVASYEADKAHFAKIRKESREEIVAIQAAHKAAYEKADDSAKKAYDEAESAYIAAAGAFFSAYNDQTVASHTEKAAYEDAQDALEIARANLKSK